MQKSHKLTYSSTIDKPKEWIWEQLIDVEHWNQWDHDVISSELEATFQEGTNGHLIDINGHRSNFQITKIYPLDSYSNRYDLQNNNALYFTHTIIEQDLQSNSVTFTAWFEGPDAQQLAVDEYENIKNTMTKALTNLSKLNTSNSR